MKIHDISFSSEFQPDEMEKLRNIILHNDDIINSAADDSLYIAKSLPPKNTNPFNNNCGVYLFSDNPETHFDIIENFKKLKGSPVLTVIADSKIVYNKALTNMIHNFLSEEGYLSGEQLPKFQLILQETIINAVEYGNLELGGIKANLLDNDEWFEKYHSIINKRLQNKKIAQKPIIIQCSLDDNEIITSVEDAGKGFDFKEALENITSAPSEKAYGRGLTLIKQLSSSIKYKNSGRQLIFGLKTNFRQQLNHIEGMSGDIRKTGKILIVDDQKSNRDFAKFYLESAGYKNIEEADDGIEALEKVTTFKPDIILLDIIMPNMDGFTTCRKLKQNSDTTAIPVLFLSGLTNVKNRIKGYRLGAVDYVNKPIDRSELIARTDTHIQNGMLIKSLNSYSNRIRADLEKARKFQHNLLPSNTSLQKINKTHGITISHIFEACDELAGDYWTVFDIDEKENIGIAVADFTGHGVVASLNTVRLHAMFYELEKYFKKPVEFTKHINSRLKKLLSIGNFSTFVYGKLNTKKGVFSYVGCGAPPIAIVPKDIKKAPYLLDCSGIPLGLVDSEDLNLELKEAKLKQGDRMLFYSDALTENKHLDGSMWEDAGLLKALEICQKNKTTNLIDDLQEIFNKTAIKPLTDDLTLVDVKFGE